MLNFFRILSIIAIFQSLLLVFFFFQNKKSSSASNRILGCMLLVFAILVADSLVINIDSMHNGYYLQKGAFVLSFSAFLIGPLFFFYIRSLMRQNFHFGIKDGWHGALFGLGTLCSIVWVLSVHRFSVWTYSGRMYYTAAVLLQNIAYLLAAGKDVRVHGLNVRSFFSYINNSRLAWIRFFMGGYILLWLVQLQLFIGWDILRHPTWCPYGSSLYFVAAFFFFNAIVWIVLKNPDLFKESQKYVSSGLKESEKEAYREQLVRLMEAEKLYLHSSLTLPELSQKLRLPPCHVSQVINESFGSNFSEFINKYRVEESKRLLLKGQKWNISEIALEAGFNSKSTFNSAFKKHTGITPKEYKHQTTASAA